ncbi:helix-turn-helix domain-containing protein [[Phormidium ambiguum] IAM M-71]|uniref:helix-turn-helix domain-containing protein n=1 Tax=[Phormidium ambiguum] IAM M-71 TaxID=454136 RepID=UPI001F1EDFE8|nr:helix-turn-helix domain-containing protein [Phormidium ambiguum]
MKNLLEAAELTEPELSRRMGIGIRIVADWKAGRKVPRFDNAIALSRELGVSLKTLARAMKLDVQGVPDDE